MRGVKNALKNRARGVVGVSVLIFIEKARCIAGFAICHHLAMPKHC
jgi:hypothetical protein